jgi:inosose dehydratase
VTDTIRWGYAINHWKPGFMGFARREEHERACKVTAACGFTAIELNAGSGRWEPLGRPDNIAINYGSAQAFLQQLRAWGIEAIASTFYDPGQMSFEDLHHGLMTNRKEDHERIVRAADMHAKFLGEVGGGSLVVRPFPSYGRTGALGPDALASVAECWNAVGRAIAAYGVKPVLHFDALSALRGTDQMDAFLKLVSKEHVGLAIDTAELTIAGYDVVDFYSRYADWVRHFHFKNALAVDQLNEFRMPNAERVLMQAGGSRGIERWFGELGDPNGLVDFPRLVSAMKKNRYAGYVIVESDKGPAPLAAAMMSNAWYVQRVLQPLVVEDDRLHRRG